MDYGCSKPKVFQTGGTKWGWNSVTRDCVRTAMVMLRNAGWNLDDFPSTKLRACQEYRRSGTGNSHIHKGFMLNLDAVDQLIDSEP